MTDACVFCDIVAGRAPASIVHEDDRTVAFMDIFPLTRGHALVVPRAHCRDLLDAPVDDLLAVTRSAQAVARAAVEAFGADGVNLLQATGAVAFQTVFHLHLHVLPRYTGDGLRLVVERRPAQRTVLEEQAGEIRARLS